VTRFVGWDVLQVVLKAWYTAPNPHAGCLVLTVNAFWWLWLAYKWVSCEAVLSIDYE
jgi:hypothetical protein